MRQADFDRRGPPYPRGPPFGSRGGGGGGGGGGPFRGSGFRDGPPGGHGVMRGPGGPGEPPPAPRVEVDRTKTVPLLLRVFVRSGAHHRIEEFDARGKEPEGCVHMYTWMDATLGELTELVQEVNDDARRPRTRLSFAIVYPDRRGRNVMRQVGRVMVGSPSVDDDRTLAQLAFQTGDLLDVALLH